MAESGLSIGWVDLKQSVGRLLGYGTTVANWSASQILTIESLVQSGVRRVYYPPAQIEQIAGHDWSFLRPYATLELLEDDYDYDLPDNFGRLIGGIHYEADECRSPIVVVASALILAKRSHNDESGFAEYVAVRYKTEDRTTGSRQEAIFYPTPDADKTMSYSYEAYSGPLSDTYPYPLGGMPLAELYIESCLAVAEVYMRDEVGIHNQQFQTLLIDAVLRDKDRGARQFGQMGGGEITTELPFRRGYTGGAYPITYDGEDL